MFLSVVEGLVRSNDVRFSGGVGMWLREARLSETGGAFARVYLYRIETLVAFVGQLSASVETAIAFARSGRASTETAIAFAGEKWLVMAHFLVAEVSSVSTVAVHG